MYNKTFKILLALFFLLPLFFIPGGYLSLAAGKAALVSLGAVIAAIFFLFETWRANHIEVPWHSTVLVIILLPVVYFLSALLTTPSSLALFGYNFEVGTFGFIFSASLLFLITTIVIKDTGRILQAISALIASFSLLAIFAAIKIATGYPTLGIFFDKTGNPAGNWTDLASILGLLSVLLVALIGMVPMARGLRNVSLAMFAISAVLIAVLNFSSVFIFTLAASIILYFYFLRVEKARTVLALILGAVSLVFLINPSIGGATLSQRLTKTFSLENALVRPSFSATLSISKAVLSKGTLLGSGPNTWSRDWLIHKPVDVNATPFWGSQFSSGSGFIPTQVASTGLLGTSLWFALLATLLWTGIRSLVNLPEGKGPRFALISSFLGAAYLWTAGFLYAPSATPTVLAFILSALFVAASKSIVPVKSVNFSRDSSTKVAARIATALAAVLVIFVGYNALNRSLSVAYFQKAVRLSGTSGASVDAVQTALMRAIGFTPQDSYYTSLSRLYFAQAQVAAATSTPQAAEAFQQSISNSIQAARQAVSVNQLGYENWLVLGSIYASLVPAPLSVEGAYENARFAYLEASALNPASPEVFLLLSQLEASKNNLDQARQYLRQAIALKEDYVDAYALLARIEVQAKNLPGAIASTERLALLNQNSPAVFLELGLLKASNNDNLGAVEAFNRALALSPNYANARYYLGLALEKLGRKEEAKEQFENLLGTNPDNEEIKAALQRLEK